MKRHLHPATPAAELFADLDRQFSRGGPTGTGGEEVYPVTHGETATLEEPRPGRQGKEDEPATVAQRKAATG
ncbi:MAG: hypothetical protein AAGD01_09130 [Acidobacteriota bacterium]